MNPDISILQQTLHNLYEHYAKIIYEEIKDFIIVSQHEENLLTWIWDPVELLWKERRNDRLKKIMFNKARKFMPDIAMLVQYNYVVLAHNQHSTYNRPNYHLKRIRKILKEMLIEEFEPNSDETFLPLDSGRVYNLETAEVFTRYQGDYFTDYIRVKFNPSVDCPDFVKFIESIKIENLIKLQEILKLCLSTVITGKLYIFEGQTTVILTLILRLLGNFGKIIPGKFIETYEEYHPRFRRLIVINNPEGILSLDAIDVLTNAPFKAIISSDGSLSYDRNDSRIVTLRFDCNYDDVITDEFMSSFFNWVLSG